MTTELTVSTQPTSTEIGPLSDLANRAKEFVHSSKATNTVRAYRSDWAHFDSWCKAHGQSSLPATPETVALYVTDLSSTHKTATVTRRISAISQGHQMAGFDTPTGSAKVRLVMAGIRRTNGTAQAAKTPVLVDELRRMIARLPNNLLGVRDRVLLLIGFCGAFRRSELVALDAADAAITRDGLVVTLRRSKTDQEGQSRKIGIPYGSHVETCPVRSLQDWLEKSGITEGPLFRPIDRFGKMASIRLSSAAVADVVKRYAAAVGLNATDFAGHSLRSGLATSAAMAGASERSIMAQTGHKSVTTVRRYIRDGSLFRENAVVAVGL
jgi:site-specific recombinase XerD